jgi:hypothetical protein
MLDRLRFQLLPVRSPWRFSCLCRWEQRTRRCVPSFKRHLKLHANFSIVTPLCHFCRGYGCEMGVERSREVVFALLPAPSMTVCPSRRLPGNARRLVDWTELYNPEGRAYPDVAARASGMPIIKDGNLPMTGGTSQVSTSRNIPQ